MVTVPRQTMTNVAAIGAWCFHVVRLLTTINVASERRNRGRIWVNLLTLLANISVIVRGPFAKFVDSPYYSESELCGGAVTDSFSKYLLR
jgi:hypothetical protein